MMTIDEMILAVPIIAVGAFMLTMLYITIEEAVERRPNEKA